MDRRGRAGSSGRAHGCWRTSARWRSCAPGWTLHFLTRDPDVFTIPKTLRTWRVRENAGGAGWELTAEDIAAIDRAFPAPDRDVPLGMI